MWLTEVASSSSGGHTQFRMNNLRTKIRRRSKYAFSSGPAGGRRREASERVDWEFVGFPSSSNKLSSSSSQQNSSVSPNSSTNFLDSSSGGFSLQQNNQNNSINNKRPQNRPEPPITFNWNEPLHPRNSWSFGAGITIEDSTPPPPVPPRCKQSSFTFLHLANGHVQPEVVRPHPATVILFLSFPHTVQFLRYLLRSLNPATCLPLPCPGICMHRGYRWHYP